MVSVIIPCFNVENYIIRSVTSALNQTVKDKEIILVDNNSSDGTLKLLHSLSKKFEIISVLSEEKKGAPFARNKGLSYAQGEWIQFLDADDELEPGKIEHQLKSMNDKSFDFVAGACNRFYLSGEKKETFIPSEPTWVSLVNGRLGNTCSNIFKRRALMAVGGWNTTMESSQEAELMFRLLKSGSQVLIDNTPHTKIYQRPSGQISDGSLENQIRYTELRLEMIGWLKENNYNFYKKNLNQLYQTIYNKSRVIASFDLSQGMKYYQQIPKSFKPMGGVKALIYKKIIDTVAPALLSKV